MNIEPNLYTSNFDFVGASQETLFKKLATSEKGLTENEARERLNAFGPNQTAQKRKAYLLIQFFDKFTNPLVLVLLVITLFSYFFGQKTSALIVGSMALFSVLLSFVQEYRANLAAERLSAMVKNSTAVMRNGKLKEIFIHDVVPGDVIELSAGDMIPADLRLINCKDLFLNQSTLTGESFPVEKFPDPPTGPDRSIGKQSNVAFMGSSVASGSGIGVVIKTGLRSEFGAISQRISRAPVETSFNRGINKFTILMIQIMIVMVIVIFLINVLLKRDLLEAFLFSLAVAVGLTPEMLPMIVTINFSKGAIDLSKNEVIVKRLDSIQNFGAMDILCTDKTGTLTLDKIVLEKYCDVNGKESEEVLKSGYLNSYFHTGVKNILDRAILKHEKFAVAGYKKVDEIPFDFERKLLSVVVKDGGASLLISKGAPEEIFKRCSSYEAGGTVSPLTPNLIIELEKEFTALSSDGFRVLAIAYKQVSGTNFSKNDENNLTLKGYLAFLDPPKPTAHSTINSITKLGIQLKVLTGDADLITRKICQEVGIDVSHVITGDELSRLDEKAFALAAEANQVFTRLDPLQKEKIILALQKSGHTVGYLGDGINDAPALKAADVGISVNNAVDVAKETADIILLRKSLRVLRSGVIGGRKIFGNILKYVKMGSSSNFGNMFSMTGASIFLPFLPMLPTQILLNNFLYDLSQTAIPSDNVDDEYAVKPRPWNVDYIRKFMIIIGPISSIFDFITFGVLLLIFHASQSLFHTGWFIESLCTQTLVVYIIRTGKIPFLQSWPSRLLALTSLLIVTVALVLPYTPLAAALGFVIPPVGWFIALLLIIVTYLLLVEVVKNWFIKRFGYE